MSGEGVIAAAVDVAAANMRNLRKAGIALECAAASFTGVVQRVEAGQAVMDVFDHAVVEVDYARDDFRRDLESITGLNAATIERWLAL